MKNLLNLRVHILAMRINLGNILLAQFSCKSDEFKFQDNILVVVAHSDDETPISGTLAKLVARGYSVTGTYTISGDDGHDVSGQRLSGDDLVKEREKAA